ncbi:hypothetical protein CCZ20_27880 [Priestia aryabhattai]|uniref:hypothetical protein n=1 Tax=Priestia aryabhattai TaxID=412384 RepID=UPI000B50B09E|nr:hypothetical protein [Priestia aryabhattai]OVE34187.1 hypothetical protein CCZ20_27880 [Priestia aryabhattai]
MKGINHLFLRLLYLSVCWLVAIKPVLLAKEPDKLAICSTLFLFFVPLFIDYCSFEVNTKKGRFLKYCGAYSSLMGVVFTIVCSYEGIVLHSNEKAFGILKLWLLWRLLSIWVILSFGDWLVLSFDPVELKIQKIVKKKMRKQKEKLLKETPLSKRISYYEKEYEKPTKNTEGAEV